jgi:predicted enzyme involved in methoxymalonyl-ACP biosynthesis
MIDRSVAELDTLLMSCRILGRNVEFKFMDELIKYLNTLGIETIHSAYAKTAKNDQVKDFFDRIDFEINKENQSDKSYSKQIREYNFHQLGYINVKYA